MNKVNACEKCGMTYEQYWLDSVPCTVAGSGYHPFVVMDVSAQPLRAADAAMPPSAKADSSLVIVPAVESDTQPRP